MKRKLLLLSVLILFFFLSPVNARKKITDDGHTLFIYETRKEFCEYWFNVAEAYPLVYIDVIRNESGAKDGTLSSLLYDGSLTFAEVSTYWQLGATFLNNHRNDMKEGRYFYLPNELELAVKYWDTLKRNM